MSDYNSTAYDLSDPKIKALADELWQRIGGEVGSGMTVPEAFHAALHVVCYFINREDELINKQEMVGQVADVMNACLRVAQGRPAVGDEGHSAFRH